MIFLVIIRQILFLCRAKLEAQKELLVKQKLVESIKRIEQGTIFENREMTILLVPRRITVIDYRLPLQAKIHRVRRRRQPARPHCDRHSREHRRRWPERRYGWNEIITLLNHLNIRKYSYFDVQHLCSYPIIFFPYRISH